MAATATKTVGKLVRISGPMIEADGMPGVSMGEIVRVGKLNLMGEVIRIDGEKIYAQVFERHIRHPVHPPHILPCHLMLEEHCLLLRTDEISTGQLVGLLFLLAVPLITINIVVHSFYLYHLPCLTS